jgi:hypothetical protein
MGVLLRLFAEVPRLLEAEELLQGLRDEWRPIRFWNELQECVRRYGSLTGILQGRSYDPWRALQAIHITRPLLGNSAAFQILSLA